ncbi:hypothetical protein CYMTET_45864 [Cymbomonas tetramitiformis]|uniref:Deoxyhypusine synthase n=1 Tax=Cymbomonas tetramitiformis TaxID=36881 RepID=A0AAE0EY65_9CHLO|nr:hypothetical protein CYMTET_45864 [Cymbomonas tetramitiformis]
MAVPSQVADAVLVASEKMPDSTPTIRGYDFAQGVDYPALLNSMMTTGFQASSFGQAVEEIKRMISWRLSQDSLDKTRSGEEDLPEPERANVRCKIFLGFTSNLVSAGVRETIKYLFQNCMVDCAVTTAGGIEEDLIKCLAPTYMGDFHLDGRDLRQRGLNRIGNMLVPNDNYCKFEDWIMPILDQMLKEQLEEGITWTPSKVIWRLGKEIDNEDSICYWAYKNKIPIFCPAITDGSIGDMLYFHTFKNPGLIVDLVQDIRRANKKLGQSSGLCVVDVLGARQCTLKSTGLGFAA